MFDRAEEAKARIDADGLVVAGRQGPKQHPLIRVEQAARNFVAKGLKQLGVLPENKNSAGRPAGKNFCGMSYEQFEERERLEKNPEEFRKKHPLFFAGSE